MVDLPFDKKGTAGLARLRGIAPAGTVSNLPTMEAKRWTFRVSDCVCSGLIIRSEMCRVIGRSLSMNLRTRLINTSAKRLLFNRRILSKQVDFRVHPSLVESFGIGTTLDVENIRGIKERDA